MKERGILFSAPMVLALLAGRKTQTRRVAKFKFFDGQNPEFSGYTPGNYGTGLPSSGWVLRSRGAGSCWNDRTERLHSPYGYAGDRLWVRETWAPAYCSVHPEYGDACWFRWDPDQHGELVPGAHGLTLHYRADGEDKNPAEFSMPHGNEIGWRPSIFMPRWASRITLEVTGVRVERLQEISEADAKAEGVEPYTGIGPDQRVPGPGFNGVLLADQPHRLPYADLWNSINGEDSWDSNPWVWVVEFKRVSS